MRALSVTSAIKLSGMAICILFAIKTVELIAGITLAGFGIVPRTQAGLTGILFSPLLHANLAHLASNAVPLFCLLILILSNKQYQPGKNLCLIWLLSGLGTWIIGRSNTLHVGASSVIFGLTSFLILSGFLLKNWRTLCVSLFVLAAFGGILWGIVPQDGYVSWEGHLSGAVSGLWAAKKIRSK